MATQTKTTTKTTPTAVALNWTKTSAKTVQAIQELATNRSAVSVLEKQNKQIVEMLEAEFGKDSEANTTEFDTLTHHNIPVATISWRSRSNFSSALFVDELTKALVLAHPEMAKELETLIGEAEEAATSQSHYTVINALAK